MRTQSINIPFFFSKWSLNMNIVHDDILFVLQRNVHWYVYNVLIVCKTKSCNLLSFQTIFIYILNDKFYDFSKM